MNKLKKASITLETGLLFPTILFTIIGTLFFCFWMHNLCYMKSVAYEGAITGGMLATKEGFNPINSAREKIDSRLVGFFGKNNISVDVKEGGSLKVNMTIKTKIPLINKIWEKKAVGSSKILNPTKYILNIKALKP